MTNTITAEEKRGEGEKGIGSPRQLSSSPLPLFPSAADLAMALTAIVEAYQINPLNRALSETEVAMTTSIPARVFVDLGWLRKEKSGRYGFLFFPAGPVLAELAGVSHNPPNEEGNGTGRPLPSSITPPNTGAAPVPVAPALKEGAAGVSPAGVGAFRQDAGSTITKDLADMISMLREVSDATRKHLIEIGAAQELEGWPDYTQVENATCHLLRLSSDLHNALLEYQVRLAMNVGLRRRK